MKRIKYLIFAILMMILFMPRVYAADGVAIESVTVDSKSDSAVIVSPATFDGLSLKFDIKFSDVNDYVKYKLVIKNTTSTDFELMESTSSSSYITYEYGYEDGNKVLAANSNKTMFITVKYSSAVPASSFSEGKYTETKSITINLEDGTDEVTNPSTLDCLYCYLVLLVGTLVFSIALLKLTKNKKFLVLVLASMVLIPVDIHAIVKLKVTLESKVEITKPSEVTETIYWALQENGSVEKIVYNSGVYEHRTFPTFNLVISDSELEGEYKGSFAGNEMINDWPNDVPWARFLYIQYVTNIKVEGRVAPTSTAYWFMAAGNEVDDISFDLSGLDTSYVMDMSYMFMDAGKYNTTFSFDLSNWNTSNLVNMESMFDGAGYYSHDFNLNLSGWDTSNVTNMKGVFSDLAYSSDAFTLNISGWNTSKVTNMERMFSNTGNLDIERTFILPETNGNGIANTDTIIYGIDENVYADINTTYSYPC